VPALMSLQGQNLALAMAAPFARASSFPQITSESSRPTLVERQPVLAREARNRLALLQPVSHRQIPGLRFSFLTSSESVNASVGWPSASVTSVILGGGRETGR
jgi:hypothetical protein